MIKKILYIFILLNFNFCLIFCNNEIKNFENSQIKYNNFTELETLQNTLFIFVKKNEKDLIFKLIKKYKLNINFRNELGSTLLLESVKTNNNKLTRKLLNKKADPKIKDKDNNTNLHFAVKNNNKKLTKLFIKYNSAGEKNIFGETPIFISIENGFDGLTKILLKNLKNFDINCQTSDGKSLLMAATEKNNLLLVQKLLDNGANVYLVNNKNEDALFIAEQHENKKLIKLLKSKIKERRKENPTIDKWVRKIS